MHLRDLTPAERRDLADKIGANAVYIYQIGAGIRRPSARMAQKIICADPRFTYEALFGAVAINATPAPKP
jgi:DNA-binding XRE family transcriptional regulator